MIVAGFDDGDGMERQITGLGGGYGAEDGGVSVSELVSRVEELGAELEFERRMRRKVEALNEALAAELAEERRRGEAERVRAAGLARAREEEVDEERRMLRVAELWREERVRMKLADARAAVEDALREVADAGHRAAIATAAADRCGCCRSSSGGAGSPIGKPTPPGGQQSPPSGQHGQSHRREATTGGGGENPHIRRGIKGSVEFPRAVRVRPRGGERADLVSNLECQRAQLRVLMRHRSPADGAPPENLVV